MAETVATAGETGHPFMAYESNGALLRVEKLSKTYRAGGSERVVLSGVDLEVDRGEWIAIIGPSGAGKSTFLHLLATLDTPSSGQVYFASRALYSLGEEEKANFRRHSIGFVWQRHHLLADFTAAENVAAPLLLDGLSQREALQRAEDLLGQVGLGDRTRQRAAELSGGERQRVAIARALANRPELLLADEPTGELDEQNAEAVIGLMEQLHQASRLTTILATHNLALARRSSRVLALEGGSLVPAETSAGSVRIAGSSDAGRRERG
ncbi:MAG TPA: ABC transporter ATP-binding protein [Candidatus Dormibacteraeota bacterium]|nr:ABC transporter ATP-binding protein [Candidatus Dormibacteraeota bacterium]